MSRTSQGLVLALLLIVSLVTSAPARLLSFVLPADQVVMQGFTGTLWRGATSRCLIETGQGYLHLGAVRWRLSPLSLLTLSPRLTIESQWGTQRIAGDVVLRGEKDFDLHDFEASVAADLLRQFAPVGLGGSLSASFNHLLIRDSLPATGEGRLVWQEGAWQSQTGRLPLGSYAVDIVPAAGGGLEGTVLTLSGPVEAEGGLELLGRDYSVDILVGSQGSLDSQVERALSLIATPEERRYRIVLEGEFQD
jgi:hypothetical protein